MSQVFDNLDLDRSIKRVKVLGKQYLFRYILPKILVKYGEVTPKKNRSFGPN